MVHGHPESVVLDCIISTGVSQRIPFLSDNGEQMPGATTSKRMYSYYDVIYALGPPLWCTNSWAGLGVKDYEQNGLSLTR